MVVNWTLTDPPPNNTALSAYVIIEVKFINSMQWFEFGQSNITTDSMTGSLAGSIKLNRANPINEFLVRARCGNDSGNIGMGEYYEENSTFFVYSEGIAYM